MIPRVPRRPLRRRDKWVWRRWHLVVTQYAQRRRVPELDQRGQGKTDQQDERAAAGEQHWRETDRRQIAL